MVTLQSQNLLLPILYFYIIQSVNTMPRKFLGQRILPDVDFVRPSSLTLTNEELDQLPLIPQDYDEDEVLSPGKLPQRRIGKFGGTIRIKKRLESVPELFLHDFKKRPHKKGNEKVKKVIKVIKAEKETLPSLPVLVEDHCEPLGLDDKINSIFVSNPIILPIQVANDYKNAVFMHSQDSRSTNEILYDEILESYASQTVHTSSNVLKDEIERVVDNIKKQKNNPGISPKIVNSDLQSSFFSSPESPSLLPPSPPMLERISSPEYTGTSASDRWSSDDDFSDFGSIVPSLVNEEGYTTAAGSIRSAYQLKHENPAKNMLQHPNGKTMVPVKTQHTFVRPMIMYISDEEHEEHEENEENEEHKNYKETEENEEHSRIYATQDASVEDLSQMSISSPLDSIMALQSKIDAIDI